MSHADRKKRLFSDVFAIIRTKSPIKRADLDFYAMTKFGFGPKSITEFLLVLEARGAIEVRDGYIYQLPAGGAGSGNGLEKEGKNGKNYE